MATARREEGGLELAELSLRDDVPAGTDTHHYYGDNEENHSHDGNDGDVDLEEYNGIDDDVDGDGRGDGRDGREDRAPLLNADGNANANVNSRYERKVARARRREAESSFLRRRLRLLWKTLCGLLCLGTAISAATTVMATVELRRHLGRMFFALPLAFHFLIDALAALGPLLAARGDAEGAPPPSVPTSQVEFQRRLRSGRPLLQAAQRYGGGCECVFEDGAGCRYQVSRGVVAGSALAYTLLDAACCAALAAGFAAAAWAVAVEADGTVAPEWGGMHAALMATAVLVGVGAGVRLLAASAIVSYLVTRSRLLRLLRKNETPWHYTMSPLMARVALRQGGAFAAGSCVLLALCGVSYVVHRMVDTGDVEHFDHCDPLDTTLCALPFPSSFFLEEEDEAVSGEGRGGTGTGFRVSFGPKSLPYTRGRHNISPVALNAFDGFSTLAPILFYVEGMSAVGLVGPGDIGSSLLPNSTATWLIDADSGEMIPHFVELDALDPASPLAVLQPASPLRHGTRYIVAVNGVLGDWGELLPPTPGFQELVDASEADRTTPVRPDLRLRANRFSQEIFPVLREIYGCDSSGDGSGGGGGGGGGGDSSGDSRPRGGLAGAGLGDVQLAWDFVTASEESQLGVLREMRGVSNAWLDAVLPPLLPPLPKEEATAAGGAGSGAPDDDNHNDDDSNDNADGSDNAEGEADAGPEDGSSSAAERGAEAREGGGRREFRERQLQQQGRRRREMAMIGPEESGGGGSDYLDDGGWERATDGGGQDGDEATGVRDRLRGGSPGGAGNSRSGLSDSTGDVSGNSYGTGGGRVGSDDSGGGNGSSSSSGGSSNIYGNSNSNHNTSTSTRARKRAEGRRLNDDDDDDGNALLYRVLKVAEENDDDGSSPIARTVWGRMSVPAFVSPGARGGGLLPEGRGVGSRGLSEAWGVSGTGGGEEGSSERGEGGRGRWGVEIGEGRGGDGGGESDGSVRLRRLQPKQPEHQQHQQPERQQHQQRQQQRVQNQLTLEVGFVVRVPRCVASGDRAPSAVVQYGHGLFGDRSEVEDGFLDKMAESGAWVLVAADWRGMSRTDLTVVAKALVSKPELLFSGVPEDLMQGFVNQQAVLTLVSRRLEEFVGDGAAASGWGTGGGAAVPCAFYGISQGAILGAGYTEFSSLIRRSVLGSGGTPFALLMPRSVDFGLYHTLLELNVPRARDVRLLLSLLQMSWDRLEATAWLASAASSRSNEDQAAESDERRKAVLMQAGTGDSEVSVIGTEILARAFEATSVAPVAVQSWGIPAQMTTTSSSTSCEGGGEGALGSEGCCPAAGATLALYDYHREAAEVPDNDTPPPPGWVHMCVRHDPDAEKQVLMFIETGCVVNYCDGACERPYCRA